MPVKLSPDNKHNILLVIIFNRSKILFEGKKGKYYRCRIQYSFKEKFLFLFIFSLLVVKIIKQVDFAGSFLISLCGVFMVFFLMKNYKLCLSRALTLYYSLNIFLTRDDFVYGIIL